MHQARRKRVGKYLMLLNQQLGSGSFSQVFRAIDETTKEQVAIKVTSKQQIEEDEYTKQAFLAEIKIMKLLKSKNIIRFLDVHQTRNNYYIIQEIATDGSFDKLLSQAPNKRFNQAQAIVFMTQLLNGFGQMVKNGIVHRDMKPANILIKDGIIKIADFGFAKQSDNSSFLKTILGTPLYMSPQLLKQEKYTYKCDIWALGIIFYQMLVGYTPWDWRKSEKKSYQYIATTPIEFPPQLKISPQMKQLILGMLGYEESERFEWEQIYLHSIFAEKFKQNFEGAKKDSIKVAFIIADVRMAIHSQNIDMIKHIDHAVQGNYIDFDGFLRIFQTIDTEMTPIKIKLLYKNCLYKTGANEDTFTKTMLRDYLKLNAIRLKSIVPTSQLMDEGELKQTIPFCNLLNRLHQKFVQKKIDLYQIYRIEDKQKKNALQIKQFGLLIKKLDSEMTQDQIQLLFKQFDLNSDGKISFNEFQRTMCKIAGVANVKK